MTTYRYHYDARDGQEYRCVLMPDGKWWSARNLSWAGAGVAYNNDPALEAVYGRMYNYNEALSACPAETHLPSDSEWSLLLASIADPDGTKLNASSSLWISGSGTDDFGFAAIPAGIFLAAYNSFTYERYYAFFWSSTPDGTSAFERYCQYDNEAVGRGSDPKGNAKSVRFIIDTFVDVPPKLFGAPFQGFDRDATVTITRQIQVQESEGGSVTLIPTAPAQFDSWDIEVGLRVSAAQAQAIEASLPPYGAPSENALRLPPRGGGASFPGLLPLTPGETYDLYAYPMASPLDVQGRVAIGADLFSYRMSLRFFAAHRLGASAPPTNTPTATTTTAPEWLTGKAITHSVVDPSTSIPTISRFGASTAVSTNFHPTKQGRTRKRAITLDCLSQDRVDELVGFFRGVRHNPTTIMLDNGASGFEAVSVYLTALSFTRGDGLYWTGSLEVVLA